MGLQIGVLPPSPSWRASVKACHRSSRSGRLPFGQVVSTVGIRIRPDIRFPAKFNAHSILPPPVGQSSGTPTHLPREQAG
jgi:hypothetical protein